MKKRYLIIFITILAVLSVFVGVQEIKLGDIFNLSSEQLMVISVSRIPRLISIIVCGASMSICGLIMQQISKNKFVSPTTGGVIDGAQLGLIFSLIIIPNGGRVGQMIISFIFALIGTFIFMFILKNLKVKNAALVPLVGIMFGNIVGSITTFIAYKYDLMQDVTAFMQGNFATIIEGNYEILYITIPFIALAYLYANKFSIAGMGEDFATNLGVNYSLIVNVGLVIVAVVTASVVITVGSIPFIGLIVPNIVSMYRGDNLKNNIWITGMVGIIFVLICDILSRIIIFPYEIPIGLTVGVIGSIVFLLIIFRRKRDGN
ncbi:MAG: ABC transporter permease [Clostridium sp.]|uniref:ABC transporter permease n=1 Tax=Clostridium sp. TaxID=1506 RepID=UPI003F397542